jgi:DNA polymerase-3 subunit gamma/tau
MLETILSRCTKFNLKSPSQDVLSKHLESICKLEDVNMEKEAVNLVALSGDGSYRDALSNLQKVLAFPEKKYTEDFVSKVLGVPPVSAIFEYLRSLDGVLGTQEGVKVLEKLEKQGIDPKLFSKELTYFARLVLLSRHKLIDEKEVSESYGEHISSFIKDFLQNKQPKFNSVVLAKLLEAEIAVKYSSLPFLSYELLLL